jgi:DNA-binding beta-propeller fold protein YncE
MHKLLFFCLLITSSTIHAQIVNLPEAIQLPNGWRLSPAGESFGLGDLPLNLAVSNSEKYIAVTNNGQSTQSIQLIDVRKKKVIDSVVIEKSWYGLSFTSDDRFLYASGGHDNRIIKYEISSACWPGD